MVASFLRGAFPPVLFLAVCLVRAMVLRLSVLICVDVVVVVFVDFVRTFWM
jgi:hypothetical protein